MIKLQIDEAAVPARFVLAGRLDRASSETIWEQATSFVERTTAQKVVLDASQLEYCDGFGAGLILDVQRRLLRRKLGLEMTGLKPDITAMLQPFHAEGYVTLPPGSKPEGSAVESVGDAARGLLEDIKGFAEFTGEMSRALGHALLHPSTIRWKDVVATAVAAGSDAIPVMVLVGFLIGFVIAFQSAIPMRQFGADVFLPSLVGIAMLRELGPIMTAVSLAGRSGAAFAAEIGTMKVNEEVSALITLGLTPVKFLVVPRLLAAMAVTPFLIVFANVAGLLGGLLVFIYLGYPPQLYVEQLTQYVHLKDLLGGLFKGFAFGFVVAAVGCMRGLQTTTGSSAVGRSTTSSVVTSIVLVAVGDGIFALLYYSLGI